MIVKMNMGCCRSAVRIFLRYSSGRLSAGKSTRDSAATSPLGERIETATPLELQLCYMEYHLYGMELRF